MGNELTEVRIDKYLWATRLFKTRALSSEACERGRISVNGMLAKASRMIRAQDRIALKKPPVTFQYQVLRPLANRVAASLVPEYLQDLTPPEEMEKNQTLRQISFVFRDQGTGRPTKKERRDIDRLMNPEDL